MRLIGNIKGMHSTKRGELCNCLYVDTGKRIDFKYENTLDTLLDTELDVIRNLLLDKEWASNRITGGLRKTVEQLKVTRLITETEGKIFISPHILWQPNEKYKRKYPAPYKSAKGNDFSNW